MTKKKKADGLGIRLQEKKSGTLGNAGRSTMKEGGWELDKEESTHLEKMTKRWSNQKGGSKKEHLEALERKDWKSTLRTPQKKVSWGLFGGKPQNKNIVRK